MNIILNLLRSDGSIVINKSLAREIGLKETIIYGELISKYGYFEERDRLTEDGFFYCTAKDLEDSTTLSIKQQAKAIKVLTSLNLIEIDIRGLPAKRYFKINTDVNVLVNLLQKAKSSSLPKVVEENLKNNEKNQGNLTKKDTKECDEIAIVEELDSKQMAKSSSMVKTTKLEWSKQPTNNTNINNTNNNTKDIYSKENKTIMLKDKDYHLERYSKDINDIIRKNSTYRINKLYLEKYEDVFIDLFRIICIDIPKPRTFGNKRKKALAKILKSFSFEEVIDVLVLVNKSDFLSGRVPNSIWKADLDWILQLEKFEQILNGKFNNRITTTGNLVDTAIVKAGEKMEDIEF